MARFACSGFNSNGLNVASVLADFREESDMRPERPYCVMVEELNVLRERTGRHIPFDRLRLLWNHSWLSAGYEVAFGSFNDGAAFVDSLAIAAACLAVLPPHVPDAFLQAGGGNRHHGFVESIDGRIVLPVKRAIKLQLLFIERTEFLYGYVFDFDTRFRLGGILSLFRLTAGFCR